MRRKGFTLIELLVVISIIALLLSIMMPALNRVKEAGRRTVCGTQAKGLTTAIYAYAVNNRDNIPSTRGEDNAAWNHFVYTYFGAGNPTDGWYGLGLLHKENLVENADVFFCPSQRHPQLDPDLYFPAKTFSGFSGKLPRNFNPSGSIAMGSLSYGLTGDVKGLDPVDEAALKITDIKLSKLKNRPLVTDIFIPLKDGGVYKSTFAHSGNKGGLNVAYGDGSTSFVRLTQSVFEVANTQMAYDYDNKDAIHRADRFAATMMQLLMGQPKYMEKYFDSGNTPFGINR